MAVPTIDDIKALSLGYLAGYDLLQCCPAALLQSVYIQNSDILKYGCEQAYEEIRSNLINRYDIEAELAITPPIPSGDTDTREKLCVRITAIKAVGNIMGGMAAIGPKMEREQEWAQKMLDAIRKAQANLKLKAPPPVVDPNTNKPLPYPGDEAILISSSFKTLG